MGCHSTRGYHARDGRGRRPLRSSRFERSRWRLRRMGDAMGKAARFRLVFGPRVGSFVTTKQTAGHFAAGRWIRGEAGGGRTGAIVQSRFGADTRVACEPKPIARLPGSGRGYDESLMASW